MPKAYLVRVRAASEPDQAQMMQVVAESPLKAVEAVRAIVEPGSVIDVDPTPISEEEAAKMGFTAGKPRLN